ncbi:MAG TPA: DUF1343 domain-containing protein [Gemmatimonadaceae bacterium]|nr:DUF1343 domain-containing protein [Gemmatimonadaceae bacterium]
MVFQLASVVTLAFALVQCRTAPPAHLAPLPVRPGLDVFLADIPSWAEGKRIGLITNFAGIDHAGRSNVDLLSARKDVKLVTLFAFEHGLRGNEPAGAPIPNSVDERTGVPVYSLYGDVHKPTAAMLEGVEIFVYDVQDVGARPYTRVSTMALSMQAAAQQGIPFVVLDRPNPVGGVEMEGPVLEPGFASFVGMYPIPLRHGMTVGELARFYNERFGINADLRVVPVQGLRRAHRFTDTRLPWVGTSPNIQRLEAALLYPGTVLIEGTNLSEGRGTTTPFEIVGAPWLRSADVVRELDRLKLPGVRVEAITFAVQTDARKYGGQTLPGVRLIVTNPDTFRPVRMALHLIDVVRRLHPADFAWTGANRREPALMSIDRLAGTDRVRKAIEGGTLAELLRKSEVEVAAFRATSARYQLYR